MGLRSLLGTQPDQSRCAAQGDYDPVLDRASGAIVIAALRHDPLALVKVWLHGLALYAWPSDWSGGHFQTELGFTRTLDPAFVAYLDRMAEHPFTVTMTHMPSLLTKAVEATIEAEPVILWLGLLAGPWIMLRRRTDLRACVAAAGLLATLLTVPIYSNYVIPRYMMAALLPACLLLALVATGVGHRSPNARA